VNYFFWCNDPDGRGDIEVSEDGNFYAVADSPARRVKKIVNTADWTGIAWDAAHLAGVYVFENEISITLSSWRPVGTTANPFIGTLRGNGKTISLNSFDSTQYSTISNWGIFGKTNGAWIQDLNIILNSINLPLSLSVAPLNVNVGGLAGDAANTRFKNISLSGSLTAESTSGRYLYTGGMIGYCYVFPSPHSEITNCISNVDVKASQDINIDDLYFSYAGGLVGWGNPNFQNCQTTGTIQAESVRHDVYAGGIIGGNQGGSIINCYSSSPVKGLITDKTFGTAYAGGITAHNYASGVVSKCGSTGPVEASTTGPRPIVYVGGISGNNNHAKISESYASGSVKALVFNTALSYDGWHTAAAGGIAGVNQANTSEFCIADCYATGSVTAQNVNKAGVTDKSVKEAFAGGIAGINKNAFVYRSYASGIVYAEIEDTYEGDYSGSGGIAGYNDHSAGTPSISACAAINDAVAITISNAETMGDSKYYARRITHSSAALSDEIMSIAISGMVVQKNDANTTLNSPSEDGIEKPVEDFSNAAAYEAMGWNFQGSGRVWKFISGYLHPVLAWQNTAP
jgi:hypothetical protein